MYAAPYMGFAKPYLGHGSEEIPDFCGFPVCALAAVVRVILLVDKGPVHSARPEASASPWAISAGDIAQSVPMPGALPLEPRPRR